MHDLQGVIWNRYRGSSHLKTIFPSEALSWSGPPPWQQIRGKELTFQCCESDDDGVCACVCRRSMIAAWDFLSLFANILLTLLLSHPDAAVLLVHTLSRHICPAHVHPNTLSSCAQQEHLSMAKSTPRTEPLPLFNCLVTLWILHPLLKVFFGCQTVRSVVCKSFSANCWAFITAQSLQPINLLLCGEAVV